MTRHVLWTMALASFMQTALADDGGAPSPEQVRFFEEKIRPVLVEHCQSCHAADAKQIRGGLLLDRPSGLLMGGDSGPAVIPGNAAESLLMAALKHESFEMPPTGKLPEHVIANFATWIDNGAVDPRPDEPLLSESHSIDLATGRQFWAFQPPIAHTLPAIRDASWPRDDIDRWILAGLENADLHPTVDASRTALLRRLTFDLTGLPPSPAEIEHFLADNSHDAVARVVDKLIASPRFGERWGRHWLDIARYADSTGGGRSMLYGESWYYRNYVINAFNSDKPFNSFLVEQIAGDLLESDDLQTNRDRIAATAFLALGPTNYELQDKKQLRMDVVDEQLDTLGRAFLGMTIGCARCHDHKFDPIPQSDYYAMAGILRNTQTFIDGNVAAWITRPLPVDAETAALVTAHQALVSDAKQRVDDLKKRTPAESAPISGLTGILVDDDAAEFTQEWTESTSVKPFLGRGYRHTGSPEATATFQSQLEPGRYHVFVGTTFSPNRCPNTLVQIEHAGGLTEQRINQQTPGAIAGYVPLGEFEFAETAKVTLSGSGKEQGVIIADGVLFSPVTENADAVAKSVALAQKAMEEERKAAAAELKAAEDDLKKLQQQGPRIPQLPSIRDFSEIEDCPLHIRGSIKNLGDSVPRGFLTVATTEPLPEFPKENSGRLQLANWLASPRNPLTARVYVNRVWSKLFGQGLVRTVDNFGVTGERPSHPELLDQLALDFVDNGWSTKRLIRRLVLTRTYQLRVEHTRSDADPDNRLLAYQNRQRLDAECLYDLLLTVSGELTLQPVDDAVREGTSSEYNYEFDVGPRAVYLPMFRNQLPDIFATFDFPNPNLSIGRRNVSTLSTQSLLFMNSPFIQERSQATARRLLQHDASDSDRVDMLYLSALSRTPTPTESRLLQDYLSNELASGTAPQEAWSRAVQAVVGSLDFRYR